MLPVLASVTGVLLVAALVCTLASAQNRLHLWVAVLLLALANLVSLLFGRV